MHIKRYILDSCWGRELSNNNNHMGEFNRNVMKCGNICMSHPYPPLVLHQSKDILSMWPSVDMIMKTLYPGQRDIFAQFEILKSSISEFST